MPTIVSNAYSMPIVHIEIQSEHGNHCCCLHSQSEGSKFVWDDEDQGTIEGNIIKLRKILERAPKFKSFRIETKRNYEMRDCSQDFKEPCPYYYTALASLVMPIGKVSQMMNYF